jgi:hypothetical protein
VRGNCRIRISGFDFTCARPALSWLVATISLFGFGIWSEFVCNNDNRDASEIDILLFYLKTLYVHGLYIKHLATYAVPVHTSPDVQR